MNTIILDPLQATNVLVSAGETPVIEVLTTQTDQTYDPVLYLPTGSIKGSWGVDRVSFDFASLESHALFHQIGWNELVVFLEKGVQRVPVVRTKIQVKSNPGWISGGKIDPRFHVLPVDSLHHFGGVLGGEIHEAITLNTGEFEVTASTGKGWMIGQWLVISNSDDPSQQMVVKVLDYDSESGLLAFQAHKVSGVGTTNSWIVAVSGQPVLGLEDVPGLGAAAALEVGEAAGQVAAGDHQHDYADLNNKPTLGAAAALEVGAAFGQVAAGDHQHDYADLTNRPALGEVSTFALADIMRKIPPAPNKLRNPDFPIAGGDVLNGGLLPMTGSFPTGFVGTASSLTWAQVQAEGVSFGEAARFLNVGNLSKSIIKVLKLDFDLSGVANGQQVNIYFPYDYTVGTGGDHPNGWPTLWQSCGFLAFKAFTGCRFWPMRFSPSSNREYNAATFANAFDTFFGFHDVSDSPTAQPTIRIIVDQPGAMLTLYYALPYVSLGDHSSIGPVFNNYAKQT